MDKVRCGMTVRLQSCSTTNRHGITNTCTVALAIGGVFGRPIPFSLRNAKHSVAKNFWIKQSGKWQVAFMNADQMINGEAGTS